jgi:hypothetical protein
VNELRTLPAALLPALLLAALLAAGSAAGTTAGSVHDEPPQQLIVTPAR